MALDRNYFDGIELETVKKKYYNAGKVQLLLEDIRRQAAALSGENAELRQRTEALTSENAELRARLKELEGSKDQISDALLTAQTTAKEVVAKAQKEAERLLSDARQRSSGLISSAAGYQEHAANCVERCVSQLRQQQEENISRINDMWREFLCGLDPEGFAPAKQAAVQAVRPATKAPAVGGSDSSRLDDLESMVDSIAKELLEIMNREE